MVTKFQWNRQGQPKNIKFIKWHKITNVSQW